jgi:hypothetical protein
VGRSRTTGVGFAIAPSTAPHRAYRAAAKAGACGPRGTSAPPPASASVSVIWGSWPVHAGPSSVSRTQPLHSPLGAYRMHMTSKPGTELREVVPAERYFLSV